MIVTIKDGNSVRYDVMLESFGKDIVSFGRNNDNDIVLKCEHASRVHGCFYLENDIWHIKDLDSTNGIKHKNNKVDEWEILLGEIVTISGSDKNSDNCVSFSFKEENETEQVINVKKKGLSKRKKCAIVGSVIAVLLLCLIVGIIIFAGKLTKNKAEKIMNEYIQAIEDKDLDKVIELSIPEKLVNDMLSNVDSDYEDYDELMNDIEYYYDYVEDDLDEINITFSRFEVEDVTRFNLGAYIDRVEKNIKYNMGEDIDIMNTLSIPGHENDSVEELEEVLADILEDYDIDIKDVYIVDCDFRVKLMDDYGKETYDPEDLFSDYVVIYKYDKEWYVIPSPIVDGVYIPSLVRYSDKSKQSNDVSSAKTIKTAVETAMGREKFYTELIQYQSGLIEVSDYGLSLLSPELEAEIRNNLGEELPEVKYKGEGAEYFYFQVDSYGYVSVYAGNDWGYYWELTPETSSLYK